MSHRKNPIPTPVSVRTGDGTVYVSVTDTGAGIAPDDLEQIFDRFYRTDPSRSRATGGSGLGLTIARQLAVAHGGALTAESTLGKGSRFICALPTTRAEGRMKDGRTSPG